MNTISTRIFEIGDWVLRQRIPAGRGPFPVIVLLHGWTGDEYSMLAFASRLPENALLLSPRGLYTTPLSGYGWHPYEAKAWPWVDDFRPAALSLLEIMTPNYFPLADFSQLRIVGFSQGAALAFSFALFYPQKVQALAGLSGFLPEGYAAMVVGRPFKDKPIFMAHGTKDELVPIEKARHAVRVLEQAGARVHYCEHDVGHKLNRDCFHGLGGFLQNTSDEFLQ